MWRWVYNQRHLQLHSMPRVLLPKPIFKAKMWLETHKNPSPTAFLAEETKLQSLSPLPLFKGCHSPTALYHRKTRPLSLNLMTLFQAKRRLQSLRGLNLEQD